MGDYLAQVLEIERAISDFWEAEAARGHAHRYAWGSDEHLWETWDGSIGDPDRAYAEGQLVPRIVWWHANRRTR